jgi:hypothetical protein
MPVTTTRRITPPPFDTVFDTAHASARIGSHLFSSWGHLHRLGQQMRHPGAAPL